MHFSWNVDLTRAAEGGQQAEGGQNGAGLVPSKNPPLAHQPKRTLVLLAFFIP